MLLSHPHVSLFSQGSYISTCLDLSQLLHLFSKLLVTLYNFFFPQLNIIFIVFCILHTNKKCNILQSNSLRVWKQPKWQSAETIFLKGTVECEQISSVFQGTLLKAFWHYSCSPIYLPSQVKENCPILYIQFFISKDRQRFVSFLF